jgi:hypothetical protein
MADFATLTLQLESLRAARRSGALEVQFGDRRIRYRSDRELALAIAATEEEIAALEGVPRVRNVVLRSPSDRGW